MDPLGRLEEVRKRINEQQREILRTIWHTFLANGRWIPIRALHIRCGGKATVQEALKPLGGSVVLEDHNSGQAVYRVTLLGVLVSTAGHTAHGLLSEYLRWIRERALTDGEMQHVTTDLVSDALKLSASDARQLYELIRLGDFWAAGAGGGASWRVGLPSDVEDLLEEAARPALAAVVPELAERLFEEVGRVQPLVGGQQGLERPPAIERQILPVGQQRVLLPFDEPPLAARHAGVLALADLIEGVAQVAQDMELVEQDAGLGSVARRRQPKGFPHVHDGEAQPRSFPRAEPRVELIQARLRAIRPAKPDRPLPDEIADDDAVGVPLADRDLVDPDDLWARRPGAAQLLAHVLLLQGLHGVPVEVQLLGYVPDRRGATAPPHVESEALGVEGIVGQAGESFLLHRATAPARPRAAPRAR